MAEKPVSPGIASSAQGPTLGSSALPSDPRFSPISLRRLLPPRLLGRWGFQGNGAATGPASVRVTAVSDVCGNAHQRQAQGKPEQLGAGFSQAEFFL